MSAVLFRLHPSGLGPSDGLGSRRPHAVGQDMATRMGDEATRTGDRRLGYASAESDMRLGMRKGDSDMRRGDSDMRLGDSDMRLGDSDGQQGGSD